MVHLGYLWSLGVWVEADKVTERWVLHDRLSEFQQLGIRPSPDRHAIFVAG